MSQEKIEVDKDVSHIDNANANGGDWDELRQDAMRAEENEMSMGLIEGLKTYPTAALWSLGISFLIVMEGYDTQVLGNIMGLSQFRERFGHYVGGKPDVAYQLDASWQTAIQQAPNIGCFM
jgi:SP family general alpha glucoside:H+ symporter-like MFS transporter